MTFASNALATRVDDLLIEDLDTSASDAAQFTWCITPPPRTAQAPAQFTWCIAQPLPVAEFAWSDPQLVGAAR